jgi:hypothetical protein
MSRNLRLDVEKDSLVMTKMIKVMIDRQLLIFDVSSSSSILKVFFLFLSNC